ncbi:Heterokaryon incompatibility protein 6, OR allele [Fusarium oxysporum f. sp. albedinis]|nr:Heterokaryon incompatibility protein 6, OR allele [Fusarium oxysporum f. sp. albedinis]
MKWTQHSNSRPPDERYGKMWFRSSGYLIIGIHPYTPHPGISFYPTLCWTSRFIDKASGLWIGGCGREGIILQGGSC